VAPARAIAVTGGIASGKSEVTRRFEARGVEVVDADVIARELVEPGQPALAEITGRFGADVLDADGRLDRRRLRSVVFADPVARHALEAILHPRVRTTLQQRAAAARGAFVLVAIPLLVESGMRARPATGAPASLAATAASESRPYDWIDRVLVVDVPRAVQRTRVMQRDGIDAAAAEALLAAQAGRDARLALATDVIINDASLAALDAVVERLHRRWSDELRQRPRH
jgi:dephospho-CoA kinase